MTWQEAIPTSTGWWMELLSKETRARLEARSVSRDIKARFHRPNKTISGPDPYSQDPFDNLPQVPGDR